MNTLPTESYYASLVVNPPSGGIGSRTLPHTGVSPHAPAVSCEAGLSFLTLGGGPGFLAALLRLSFLLNRSRLYRGRISTCNAIQFECGFLRGLA